MDFLDPDLKGFRGYTPSKREPDYAVYSCKCRCGGHVLVKLECVYVVDQARMEARPKAIDSKKAHCFGSGYYIKDHQPMGIAGEKFRVGPRTQLKASA